MNKFSLLMTKRALEHMMEHYAKKHHGGNETMSAHHGHHQKIATAHKPSHSSSHTKTQHEKKHISTNVDPGSVTCSALHIVVNKPPKHSHVVSGVTIRSRRVTQAIVKSNEGLQGVQSIWANGTLNQWMISQSPVTDPYYDYSEASYFQMNPNDKSTGSLILGSNTPATDQLFLKRTHCTIDMVNFENNPVYVDLLFFKCKSNVPSYNGNGRTAIEAVWAKINGLEQMTGVTVPEVVGVGGAAPVSAVWGYGTSNIVGANPMSLPGFNRIYTHLATKKIELAPAACHRLNASFDMNYHGKQEEMIGYNTSMDNTTSSWTQANCDITHLRKSTVICLAIIHGTAVVDTAQTVSGAVRRATYGSSSVGFVMNTENFFKTVYANVGRINQQTAISNILSGGTVGNQKVFEEQTNVITSINDATL